MGSAGAGGSVGGAGWIPLESPQFPSKLGMLAAVSCRPVQTYCATPNHAEKRCSEPNFSYGLFMYTLKQFFKQKNRGEKER